ncbi:hypothetical protein PTSG_06862 [Salpingoeca rosetta]|uniref:SSD domain-containing protein n=1 Tax=Salpingoeca rosetta (strain ATCC 50818 / BSB-021) TaxID=946362 RepID=F2UF11_SALR5|nr:uncharacterized protein PTSG_06862 [Salpingoeca rosetta]EGD75211.1 hypothetical protein PTSG_06862 [Salpingoeca rosetta]|eukprot:XP_004992264.1 hypothetical protein PTSG_06862 [Salpingoeca rosetta]
MGRLEAAAVRVLNGKAKYVMALAWIGLLVAGGLFGLQFFDETADEDDSLPKSSLAYQADAALSLIPFGNGDGVVLMVGNDKVNITDEEAMAFFDQLFALAQQMSPPSSPFALHTPYMSYVYVGSGWQAYPSPKPHYRSQDGSRLMATATVLGWGSTIYTVRTIRDASKSILQLLPEGSRVWCSGDDIIWDIILGALENDLIIGDGISIPTALVVLCLTLRSTRYVLVPLLSIAASILSSFLLMRPVAKSMAVSAVAPNLMMSLSIAMSVDYALFVFSRFREEMRAGKSVQDACTAVLSTAGHTIFVSGFTFIACSLTLLSVPVKLLASMGVAAAITVACTVVVNLTLVPTIILIFPSFFREATTDRGCCSWKKEQRYVVASAAAKQHGTSSRFNDNHGDDDDDDDDMLLLAEDEDTPLTRSAGANVVAVDAIAARARKSPWYRFGKRVTRRAWLCIAIITALAAAAFYPALTFRHVSGVDCECPQNYGVVKDFYAVSNTFGAGYILPFGLLIEAANGSLLTQQHFNNVAAVCNHLAAALPDVHVSDFDGLAINNGVPVSFTDEVSPCFFPNGTTDVPCYQQTPPVECVRTCFNKNYFTTNDALDLVWLRPRVDGSSARGQKWIHRARAEIETLQEQLGVRIMLARGGVEDVDMIAHVFGRFHVAIASVAAVVFVLMLLAFRSVAIALKAVLSIALTQGLVYGISTCVYDYGIFAFLGWNSLAPTGGLCWIPSILVFTILVGLGLDYHIFLLSRVVEFRRLGFDDEESVLLGLARTGRVITAAGVIMAIAFLGLLFSHEALVQQLAFFIVIAVLIDTFVVRACLVPAMMSVLGRFNWWPLTMPKVTRSQHLEPGTFGYGPIVGHVAFGDDDTDTDDVDVDERGRQMR